MLHNSSLQNSVTLYEELLKKKEAKKKMFVYM